MGQLLVRGVEDEVIARLKERAAANGRSVEAEHREILRSALAHVWERDREALIRDLRRLQAETAGRGGPTGTDIIREDRDSR